MIDVLSDEPRRVEMGRAAREHALANYAWDDIARRLEETYAEVDPLMLRDRRLRALLVVPLIAAAVALFVYHGPNWHLVHDAFTVVLWRWVIAAIGLNLLSVLARALSWDTTIKQSARPTRARVSHWSSPPSRSACLRTQSCRAASVSSRASRCCAGASRAAPA